MVERELRVALLRRGARRQWLIAAWTAGGVTLFFLLIISAASIRSMGHALFEWLFALGCAGVVSRAFGLTADLFSEERRNGTLGLLVLTGLRPLEIFYNKLLGALLLAAYTLLGGLPFFAIPFLTGGVPATQFVCALAFLVNALLFCVAIGLLASVVHRDGGQAQITAMVLTAVLSLATPAVRWTGALASGMAGLSQGWLTLSPAYAPYLVFTGFAGGSPRLFWIGSGVTLGYSLIALLLAAVILQRTWRDGPEVLAPKGWRERWRKWARGSQAWRRRIRTRLLPQHPFCWLAARDRRPVLVAKVFVAMVVALWLGGWATWGKTWLTVGNVFVSCIVLHSGLIWILAYAAAKPLAEERLNSGFEVLLTTPLAVEEIVEGQQNALSVQFKGVLIATLVADALLCAAGLAMLPGNVLAMTTYVLAWGLLLMLSHHLRTETTLKAMWISAWTGRPAYAAQQAMWPVLWPAVYVTFFARGGLAGFRQMPGFLFAVILIMFLLAVFAWLKSLLFPTASKARPFLFYKLITELRDIACAPIPARGDKRFRRWDPRLIYPPGRWGELELREAKPNRLRPRC